MLTEIDCRNRNDNKSAVRCIDDNNQLFGVKESAAHVTCKTISSINIIGICSF
jgi:hypothetical protein